jgi:hypothetical protein
MMIIIVIMTIIITMMTTISGAPVAERREAAKNLASDGFNQSETADILGVNRETLRLDAKNLAVIDAVAALAAGDRHQRNGPVTLIFAPLWKCAVPAHLLRHLGADRARIVHQRYACASARSPSGSAFHRGRRSAKV